MTKDNSYTERFIKVGSNESRIRWGLHRLGIQPDVQTESNLDTTINKELLPTIELTMPIYFAGKVFLNSRGTTDHIAHSTLESYYVRHIANSNWAKDHVYGNGVKNIALKPANFSEPRYRIFGVQGNDKQSYIFNVEWHTEGDYDVERGRVPSSSRNFGSTEMRTMDTNRAVDLLSQGYDIWSALAGTPVIMWANNTPLVTGGRDVTTNRFKESATETIKVSGIEQLWDNSKWLENDLLVATFAETYLAIDAGKSVIIPKNANLDFKTQILFGQAISQMFAIKKHRLIGFVTDRGILGFNDSKAHQLTFTDENIPSYLQRGDIFIKPSQAKIGGSNEKLVNILRTTFRRPLNVALGLWREADLN